MSNELLQKLERKVDNAVETIELLRLQIEELEEKNAAMHKENNTLHDKQKAWEQNLNMMLAKLEGVEEAEQIRNTDDKQSQEQHKKEHSAA